MKIKQTALTRYITIAIARNQNIRDENISSLDPFVHELATKAQGKLEALLAVQYAMDNDVRDISVL